MSGWLCSLPRGKLFLNPLLKLKGTRALCQEYGAKDLALDFIGSRCQMRLVQNETTKERWRDVLNGLGLWSPPWLPPSLLVSFFPELCQSLFRTSLRHWHITGHSRKSPRIGYWGKPAWAPGLLLPLTKYKVFGSRTISWRWQPSLVTLMKMGRW